MKANNKMMVKEWIDWLRFYKDNRYELSQEENLALCNAIMESERIAQEFFYKTLAPMNSGLAYQVLRTYKIVIDERNIATTIYREMYDEGRFTRLKGFKGDCSIFTWIAISAAQIIYDDLQKLGLIKKNANLTPKNTSLRLKSMRTDELLAVLDLLNKELWYDLLVDIYVNRVSKESLQQKYEMDEKILQKTVKLAETSLKEQLIETECILWNRVESSNKGISNKRVNLVSIALGDVSACLNYSTSEEAFAIAENKVINEGIIEDITDMLRLENTKSTPEELWNEFVLSQAKQCGFSQKMYDVWQARYVKNESPDSVAMRMNVRRTNVDNLYSHANALLVKKIRSWWVKNS